MPPRGILLDIEGTTSAINFVYDVLMPHARSRLGEFLRASWESPDVLQVREAAREETRDALLRDDRQRLQAYLLDLDARDVKATSLKMAQGLIWRLGYDAGELKSHVYDDVPPALRRWNELGADVRIYSSGSVMAQRAFFSHTGFGDLLPLLMGHYDTTTGPKRSAASYIAIAADMALPAGEILFISDVPAELDAARQAQMQTALCVRGDLPPDTGPHRVIRTFAEV